MAPLTAEDNLENGGCALQMMQKFLSKTKKNCEAVAMSYRAV